MFKEKEITRRKFAKSISVGALWSGMLSPKVIAQSAGEQVSKKNSERMWPTYGDLPPALGMDYPTPEEFEAGLRRWQAKWPECLSVAKRGHSVRGWPIYRMTVTDQTVPDDDKQVLLLSSCHGYGTDEISSPCGILHFMKWLLSDDLDASRLRRGLVVASMPVIGKMYTCWDWNGPVERKDMKEDVADAKIFFEMMEELRPDAHVDIHGLAWRDLGMAEDINLSTPRLNRCFDPGVVLEIERAVELAGYSVIRDEIQAGRTAVATARGELGAAAQHFDHFDHVPDKYQFMRVSPNPTTLSFHRYHSLSFTAELYWMGSIVTACRRMAEIGLETKFWDFFPGYPNNLVEVKNILLVSAWGGTAAQRRRSRIELWNRCSLALDCGGPTPMREKILGACATTPAGAQLVGAEGRERFLERIRNDRRFNAPALADFLREYPPTLFARTLLMPNRGGWTDISAIRNGLSLRICLQYRDAKVREVRHNGHFLKPSAADGYLIHHRQGTVVQVNIPPEKVHDLHIVTIRYDAVERPLQGFTAEDWNPEVLRIGPGL